MLIATALFYSGQLFESIPWFKKSIIIGDDLEEILKKYRDFHFVVVKRRLGLITEEEYLEKIKSINKDSILAHYQKLGELVANLKNYPNHPQDNFVFFENTVFKVIEDDSIPWNIKLLFRNEYLLHLGYRFNMEFANSIAKIKDAQESMSKDLEKIRINEIKACMNRSSYWHKQIELLVDDAKKNEASFIFYNVLINESKVIYQFQVFLEIFNLEDNNNQISIRESSIERLEQVIRHVELARTFFEEIAHLENLISTLFLLYEINDFINPKFDSSEIKKEILKLASVIDSKAVLEKVDFLFSGGTTHEFLRAQIGSQIQQMKKSNERLSKLIHLMEEIDKLEVKKIESEEYYHVELFPIGHFSIPASSANNFLSHINAKETAKKKILALWRIRAVPRINILFDPVIDEGYLTGKTKRQSVADWERFYEIRKYLFSIGAFRVDY